MPGAGSPGSTGRTPAWPIRGGCRTRSRSTPTLPNLPSPQLAARLLNHVWEQDEEFGLYLWEAMVTGARRGELLAQREDRLDFGAQAVAYSRNYLVRAGQHIEKDAKTGEDRWVSLDPLTCDVAGRNGA